MLITSLQSALIMLIPINFRAMFKVINSKVIIYILRTCMHTLTQSLDRVHPHLDHILDRMKCGIWPMPRTLVLAGLWAYVFGPECHGLLQLGPHYCGLNLRCQNPTKLTLHLNLKMLFQLLGHWSSCISIYLGKSRLLVLVANISVFIIINNFS